MPRPATALIVDDEPHVIVLMRTLLKELGVSTVWEATNAAEALVKVLEHGPGVVLLDINMPQVDGLTALVQMKDKMPAVPVVIVTAQCTVRTLERAVALGAHAFVLKFETKAELLRQLGEALDSIGSKPAPMGAPSQGSA